MNSCIASLNYFDLSFDNFLNELKNFLQIPSVSTNPDHAEDIQTAATFLVQKLQSLGFQNVKAYQTDRHPIVYGEWLNAGHAAPTLLIYGHYDVQPPDPLDEWQSGPFDPVVKDDYLIARGASDMKGQIMAAIFSLESVLKTSELPLNIKFILEGEEEIGSPSLDAFLETHKELLKADFVLNLDAGMISPDKPTIVVGLRGLSFFELRVFGPKHDLHSGLFGGVIANPVHIISQVISDLHDENGKVTLPKFYDHVRPLTSSDREKIAALGIPDSRYLELTGVPKLHGEKGFTPLERVGARPTLDVNGIYAGFIGEGSKTIIPAYAKAKISCRLVPDQDPEEVYESFAAFCKMNIPDTVTYEIIKMSGAPAYLVENAPGMENLVQAFETVWQTKVSYKREGGSVPVATSMKNILGIDSLLTGFGLPDDQIHSPNERLHLPTWKRGIHALIVFLLSFS
jgi:acetylornithine deacetylase/succinyl-diaminopimelate desuccinylase-like protein